MTKRLSNYDYFLLVFDYYKNSLFLYFIFCMTRRHFY